MSDKLIAGGPSQIEKVLYRLLEKIKVFLFLVDGSGSVPPTGFQTMINTVRSIANRINIDHCYIGVFQYSTKVTPSCTPTSNLKQFHQALDSMIQDRQGNEEALALDAAVKALKECPLTGERLIIHLTDGGLMGSWKAAATNIKYTEKIQIMSIGVGEHIDAHNIREFASPELAFFVKDYQELQKMFQFLDLAPLPAPVLKPVHEKKVDAREIHLELEAYPLAADVKGYHVEVVESSASEWRSAGFSLKPAISVKDNIRPNTTYTVRTYVELKNGRVSTPSNEVTVTTLPPNPHTSVVKNLPAAVAARIKDCQEFTFCSASVTMGMDNYNALIAGVPGAGKSSTMTAVNSMLCGKYQPCGANGEVNETLTRVVTEFEALKKLSVIDTPGIRDENLKLYEKHLYYGGVPAGYDERNPDFTKIRNVDQIPIQEQVHCVVLAVSCETLVDAHIMTMLKQQYEIILKQGRNCIILLTKVDKVDARIKLSEPATLSLVYESGIVMNFRKSLATHLGLNVDCVLPIVSYNAPMNPIPWVSMLHLDWIEKALQMSDGFCSTFLSVEKSKRLKKTYLSTDELMAQIFKDKLAVTGATSVVPAPTNYSASPEAASTSPAPTPATESRGSGTTTTVASSAPGTAAVDDSAEYEILIRREEDPADDWSSIYLRNSDRTTVALKAAICERYPPRTPAAIVKVVEERKVGANTINKKVESNQDVGHLINSAMKGNMVFVVVSFSVVSK